MLESVSATELAFAVLVVFFACTVFSAMGFGIGIVGLPFLFLMFDPATSIILLNVMALPVVVLVVLRNREHLRPREIVPIVIAGVIGALIGGWVLGKLDIAEYKDIFGIAVLVVIIAITVGRHAEAALLIAQSERHGACERLSGGCVHYRNGRGRTAAGAVLHIAGLGPSRHSCIYGAVLHIHGDRGDSELRAERPVHACQKHAANRLSCARRPSRLSW